MYFILNDKNKYFSNCDFKVRFSNRSKIITTHITKHFGQVYVLLGQQEQVTHILNQDVRFSAFNKFKV